MNRVSPYNRRDYYKVCLVIGEGIYRSRDQEFFVESPSLIFSSPSLPSSWHSTSQDQSGFYCLFNDSFLSNELPHHVKYESPLFNNTVNSILQLGDQEVRTFSNYFAQMESLILTDYSHKYDMIRSILLTLIYEGIRIQGTASAIKINPADRVVSSFFSLLDQQFPVDSPENPLKLTAPAAYAEILNVHVNHLNTVVKKHTGKTTREIIQERIIREAKILLLNTDWNAAEIAYTLGFEYPSHFNKYFRQSTAVAPLLFREKSRTELLSNI